MFGSWAVSVVLFPSAASHLPVTVPPTPVARGVTTTSLGLLSLNGVPKKPKTTLAFVPGGPGAWKWAATRLSLGSAVCRPVKSRPVTVTLNVSAVCVGFSTKVAVPLAEDSRGGTSCPLDRLATKLLQTACACASVAPAKLLVARRLSASRNALKRYASMVLHLVQATLNGSCGRRAQLSAGTLRAGAVHPLYYPTSALVYPCPPHRSRSACCVHVAR